MQKQRLYRIVTFAGWFLSFIGIALLSFLIYSWISDSITAGIVLTIIGLSMALSGETMLSQYSDKVHRFVWEALSLGGVFALSVGLLWLSLELATIGSLAGIIALLVIGTGLVLFGESGILKEKEGEEKKPVIKVIHKPRPANVLLLAGLLAIILPTIAFAASSSSSSSSDGGFIGAGICMISTCGIYSLLYIIIPVIGVYIYKQFINPL